MRVPSLSKIVPVIVILVLGFTAGCGFEASQPRPLNVVLISMDTTRADHLGCYGNDAIDTPNIDALAARSLRFDRCFASVPITLPSHTTMLTGLFPLDHSVRDNGTFRVPDDVPTLATILGQAGRTTLGVIGAFPLNSQFGLSRDFDVWDEDFESRRRVLLPLAFEQRPADRVTRRALELLEKTDDRPFFLFVHYFDPHRPWEAPALYARRYRNSPYDAEIAFTDTWIGRLLAGLEEMGHGNDTVIILAADHGEGLSDHEEETHSFLLYDGTIRVPLLLSGPGIEPGVVERPVSSADIAPTILEILGIEAPAPLDGISLLRPPPADRLIYSECLAGRLQHGWNDMRSAVVGDRKLILGAPSELYAVDDLGEREDLAEEEPATVAALEDRLLTMIKNARPVRTLEASFTAADPETRARLEALGYVTASDVDRDWSEPGRITPEGDPRRHLQLVEVQSIVRGLINEGNIPLALELLDTAFEEAPDDIELLRLAIMARTVGSDGEGAVTLIGRFERSTLPEERDLRLFVMAYRAAGELDRALGTIEKIRAVDDDESLDLMKVDILARMKRTGEARVALDRILERQPCNTEALRKLAAFLRWERDIDGMSDAYRRLIDCDPSDPRAHFNLGNAALERGDLDGAERAYLAAHDLDPFYRPADFGLALVALDRGDSERCRRMLEEIVADEPLNSDLGRQSAALLEELEPDDE